MVYSSCSGAKSKLFNLSEPVLLCFHACCSKTVRTPSYCLSDYYLAAKVFLIIKVSFRVLHDYVFCVSVVFYFSFYLSNVMIGYDSCINVGKFDKQ